MDPDKLREEIIEKANRVLGLVQAADAGVTTHFDMTTEAVELAEKVHDLDMWLRAEGFFPAAWTPPNRVRANDGRRQAT